MSEELKIIINAITAEANKNLDGVKKKLNEIDKTSSETGKKVSASLAGLAKGAAVAVAAVAGLTVAFVALGKSAMEFRKEQAKLNAAFEAMGGSAEQAEKTYAGLYRFLGDKQTATEAAQNLAKITTEEKALAEWTTILQGVYANMGDSLPVESLAEAANETIKVGKVSGTMADALNWLGVSEDAFNEKLAKTTTLSEREALVRSTLNNLYSNSAGIYEKNNKALIEYNESQLKLDKALAEATRYVVPLMTAINNLAALVLDVLGPAFEYVAATIVAFVQWIMAGIKAVASFFDVFTDKSITDTTDDLVNNMGQVSSNASGAASGVDKITDNLKDSNNEAAKLKKQLMGFDELNVMSPTLSSSGMGGGSSDEDIFTPSVSVPNIDLNNIKVPGLDDFENKVKKIKDYLEPIATLVAAAATAIGFWKIADFVSDLSETHKILKNMSDADLVGKFGDDWLNVYKNAKDKSAELKNAAKTLGGQVLTTIGLITTAYGYSDAWTTGIDWGNFGITLGGLLTTTGGLFTLFGKTGALIGALGGGLSLAALGIKDFAEQGGTIQNTLSVLIGGTAAGGAIGMMVGGPVGGLIGAAIGGVAGLTTAFILEKPAIQDVDEAMKIHKESVDLLKDAELNYISAIERANDTLKNLEEAEKNAGMSGEELYQLVRDGKIDIDDMTDAQMKLYEAYLVNDQAQRDVDDSLEKLNTAKSNAVEADWDLRLSNAKNTDSFDEYRDAVVKAFEDGELSADEARRQIEKAMSGISLSSEDTFTKDLPDAIKKGLDPTKYQSAWTKFKRFMAGCGIHSVNMFLEAINGLNDLINKFLEPLGIKGFVDIPLLNNPYEDYIFAAKGGIFNSATPAIIGEAGKEAVLPLENNTEWMDVLADRIATRNSAPSKIVLQVGEKELGWATINGINNITKQTGGLQLQLV
jgi:hypothetical protein